MDLRRRLSRALIPIAIAITALTAAPPATPVFATEPVPVDPGPDRPGADAGAGRAGPGRPPSSRPRRPPWSPPAPAPPATRRPRLIAVARRQLGDRYVYGAAGPRRFDCSGLVLFSLRRSHNRHAAPLGGRSADSFYAAYRRHHRVSRHHGHPGDLVIWGAAATSGSTSATAGRSAR